MTQSTTLQTTEPRPAGPLHGEPITVVYIVSCPFAGSTWLNMILGSHSRAFGVGEMDKFDRDFGKVLCRVHGAGCPFWSRFDPSLPEDRYAQAARLSGKAFIVNNNKAVESLGDHTDPPVRGKYLFLHRDGRAITASRMRKKKGVSVRRASRWWTQVFHEKYDAFLRFPAADRFEVYYEALLENTEREVRRICGFLGWEFEPAMLEYWNFEHHLIAGNLGTQYTLAKLKQSDLPKDTYEYAKESRYEWDVSYYKESDSRNFRDERWKKEFGWWKRMVFHLRAGKLNRELGYGPDGLLAPTR